MDYFNITIEECISEFILFGLCYVCDGDSMLVDLEVGAE